MTGRNNRTEFTTDFKLSEAQDVGLLAIAFLETAAGLVPFLIRSVGYLPNGFELVPTAYGAAPLSFIGGTDVIAPTYQKRGGNRDGPAGRVLRNRPKEIARRHARSEHTHIHTATCIRRDRGGAQQSNREGRPSSAQRART